MEFFGKSEIPFHICIIRGSNVSQMYFKLENERRNKALELRMKLKKNDPSFQADVKYPAVLMVKRATEHKYTVENAF